MNLKTSKQGVKNMQTIRYYEDLTLEDIIIDFDTKSWGGAYDRLNLLYEKQLKRE